MRPLTGAQTTPAVDEGERLTFVYEQALRGLLQQQAAVESVHARAGTLIFAASFASSLLGSRALSDGVGGWDWVALGCLVGIGALAVVLLWPYYNFSFRLDPDELLARYVDVPEPVSTPRMHRELALRLKSDWRSNGRIVRRLREALQLALILLLLEIGAWMLSIATQGVIA